MTHSTIPLGEGRLTVRSARPEDAEAWIVNVESVASERVYLMTERFTRTVEEVRAQFRDPDPTAAIWLVAEVDGKVVGGANLVRGKWAKNAHTAELGMAIVREHRGRGIGRVLLERGLEWARSVGVQKVRLGVFESNARALALYRSIGFSEEGRLQREVMLDGHFEDELLMALWIGGSDAPAPGAEGPSSAGSGVHDIPPEP